MKLSRNRKSLLGLLVVVIALIGANNFNQHQQLNAQENGATLAIADGQSARGSDLLFANAFHNQQSNIQLSGEGRIHKILPDDNDGSRHQRIIVMLEIGQTLLLSHNIDLAPRIDNLREGELIEFYGEYEWNKQGGVIHWTHHDPKGKHAGGWVKYQDKVYR